MTELQKIARVTVRGKGLDEVTDGSEKSNSFLVHQKILLNVEKNPTPAETIYHKNPATGQQEEGWLWEGAMATVVHDLWPIEATLTDPKTGQSLGHRINTYLRYSHNAVCVNRRGSAKPPQWWIRKVWNDGNPLTPTNMGTTVATYTERRLTPEEAGETRPPAPVTITHKEPTVAPPTVAPFSFVAAVETITEKASSKPKPAAPKQRDVEVVRGRQSFTLSKDGQPVPPDYPFACGLTDISGTKCRRVFGAQNAVTTHRASHPTLDEMIKIAAEMIQRTGEVNGNHVAEKMGRHQTVVYSYYPTMNDLYLSGRKYLEAQKRKAAQKQAQEEAKSQKDANNADGKQRAAEIYQLIVGFCQAVSTTINHSTLSFFPMPIPATDRSAFIARMVNEKQLTYVDSLDNAGKKTKIIVPGICFDEEIAKRLEVFKTGITPASVEHTTPEDARKLDILAVLALATDEIKSLRETEKIAADQDHQLVTLAKDRDAALELATEATEETLAARKQLAQTQTELKTLQKRFDFIQRGLTGNLDD